MFPSEPPKDKKSQADKFREAAREHGADSDEEGFDKKLRRIAETKSQKISEKGKK